MADVTGDVIRVLSELGLVQASSNGGVTPGVQLSVDSNGNTVLADPAGANPNGFAAIPRGNGSKEGVAKVMLQCGIPFIFQSSGSVGDNGALSGITALPTTYTRCYMYFPAGAIHSGSAAGWYFVVMSSTTAGTIYNNVYSSGIPSEPASPTPFVTTGPGAYTQTTGAAVTAISLTIPGGALGDSGTLRVSKMGCTANNANNKMIEAYYGGSAFASNTVTTSNTFRFLDQLANIASNRQIGSFYANLGGVATDWLRRTVDSSVDQALNLTLRLATATDFVIYESVTVEVIGSDV